MRSRHKIHTSQARVDTVDNLGKNGKHLRKIPKIKYN
jgi:hypothetical protein